MEILTPIAAALLPAALLFFYIYRKDVAQPEPPKWLWKAVGYGALSAIAAIMVGLMLPEPTEIMPQFKDSVVGAILTAFCSAAIPEEACKLLMLWLLLRKNPFFDEHLDGIVYATCVGLGFAGFENILYVFDSLEDFVSVAISRGIFAVPGHFFFAVAMGYFFSLASFASHSEEERKRNMILAFIVPVVLHGIYDACLMASSVSDGVAFICIVFFLYFCHKMQKKGRERISLMKSMDNR